MTECPRSRIYFASAFRYRDSNIYLRTSSVATITLTIYKYISYNTMYFIYNYIQLFFYMCVCVHMLSYRHIHSLARGLSGSSLSTTRVEVQLSTSYLLHTLPLVGWGILSVVAVVLLLYLCFAFCIFFIEIIESFLFICADSESEG